MAALSYQRRLASLKGIAHLPQDNVPAGEEHHRSDQTRAHHLPRLAMKKANYQPCSRGATRFHPSPECPWASNLDVDFRSTWICLQSCQALCL